MPLSPQRIFAPTKVREVASVLWASAVSTISGQVGNGRMTAAHRALIVGGARELAGDRGSAIRVRADICGSRIKSALAYRRSWFAPRNVSVMTPRQSRHSPER